MKILHLIDDEKFTDFVISENLKVDSINGIALEHYFLGFGDKYRYTVKYQKYLKLIENFNEYKAHIEDEGFEVLIIHCLTQYKAFALQKTQTYFKKIVWCMWGVDFYSLPWIQLNLYFPETKKHIQKVSTIYKIKKSLRPFFQIIRYGSTLKKAQQEVIRSIDFFSPIVPNEYNIALTIPSFSAKKIEYCYGNLNTIIGDLAILENALEANIFIGNSATPESNHYDILLKLKDLNIQNHKIIVPLSYGQPDTYGKDVKRFGESLFKEKFIGITDFIPLEQYVDNIKSCGICIMNHKRQQGLGNALLFILLGSKLFLSIENPMYQYFKSIDVKVFSIENHLDSKEISTLLDKSIVNHNRKIIENLFSENNIENVYYKFYETIIGNE